MADPDPFPKIKNEIAKVITTHLAPYGFCRLKRTTYWYRDRGELRDIFFFQKMSTNAVTFAYGIFRVPSDESWTPGIPNARWLRNQEFYRCKYIDHVPNSIGRAMADFAAETLP